MLLKKCCNKKPGRRMAAIFLVMSLVVVCNAQFAGGIGTEEDPWLIETANHLNSIRNYIGLEHGDKYFQLIADIDLGVAPFNQGDGWIPIGIDDPFCGQFDGSGFSIKNMVINRVENYQGLFSQLRNSSIVNLRLENVRIRGGSFIGGISGRASNSSITGSSVTGEIIGTNTVGGITGNAFATPIYECFTSGKVTGNSTVGGIAGNSSAVTDSYSTMIVTGRLNYVGGITGRASGNLLRCYYTGNIISFGGDFIGPLSGNTINGRSINSFWNVHSTGIMETVCGGTGLEIPDMILPETYLQGDPENHWDFNDVWSIVDGETYPFLSRQLHPGREQIPGPFNLSAEEDEENLEIDLSWDVLGEPVRFRIYRYGSPIAQVDFPVNRYTDFNVSPARDYIYFVTAVFDDNGEEMETLPSNYAQAHIADDFPGGDGTHQNPYQVNSPSTLSLIRENLTAHYIQTADINLGVGPWNEGEGWEPIGYNQINSFQGSYNGNGFVIKGLTINCTRGINRGLFGRTYNADLIKIGLLDVNINGSGYSGGLVAFADTGTVIEECFVSGRVTGSGYTGGIVGQFRPGGRLADSYTKVVINTVSTTSNHCAGGLAGYSANVEIVGNYAAGSVQTNVPTTHAGALIGWRSGEIDQAADNYWNSDTAYQETAGRGFQHAVGRTSLQMVQANSYGGFDFENVWRIDQGSSYPYFQWQGEEPFDMNIPELPAMNVAATGGEDGIIDITWEAPDNQVSIPDAYNVYRDGERINLEPVTALFYRDTGLTNWKYYTYNVTAIYGDRESFFSNRAISPTFYYAGGSGTEQDPYQIENAGQLNGMRFFLNSHFILTSDIDLGVSPWNDGSGWKPIGNAYETPFTGSLNGCDYVISNLFISRREEDNIGIFGYAASAHLSNIGLLNVDIIGKRSVAALVAQARGNTIIEKCYVSGIVRAFSTVGGLAGGINQGGRISDCYSVAAIEVYRRVAASHRAGGIVGSRMGGDVVRNYVTGPVTTVENSTFVGALMGRNGTGEGIVANNYWNSETTGQPTGGDDDMPGNTTTEMLSQETYQGFNFNTTWQIEEGESYPFLIWEGEEPGDHNSPNLQPPVNLSAIGGDRVVNLTWSAPTLVLPGFMGYIIYRDGDRINEQPLNNTQYEDSELPNWQSYRYHVTAMYELGESAQSVPADAITYNFAGGSGTQEEPFLIETAAQLNGVRLFVNSHFRQIADIDLNVEPYNEGEGWEPIGVYPNVFRGSYNGGEYVISGLTINRPQSSGQALFTFSFGARISNIGLVDVDIDGGNFVAGLVADIQTQGTVIENCFVTGNISGFSNVGGIAGQMRGQNNSINNCYSTASIRVTNPRGHAVAGGIIGYLQTGEVRHSYAVGPIYAFFPSDRTGAVIGRCDNNEEVSENYWNIDTTAQATGGYNVGDMPGHTTHQLLRMGTLAGFDFDTVWNIDEGRSYPFLRWEGDEPGTHNIPGLLPPRNLMGVAVTGNIRLSWNAPSDPFPAPDGYNIYRNNEIINEDLVNALEYLDEHVEGWQYYNYHVTAVYEESETVPGNIIRVLAHTFQEGTGEENDPFLVETTDHFNGIRYLKSSHYRQIADIDLQEFDSWTPFGERLDPFHGSYDGNEYAIQNLRINSNISASLFGFINGALLSNVVIFDADFRNVSSSSGLLASEAANSTITGCRVTGTLISGAGGSTIGGFIGKTDRETEISNSTSNVEILISGGSSGGFVGFDNGAIYNCISLGSITSTAQTATFIGGFVGRKSLGSLVNSYSRCFVNVQEINITTSRIGGFAGYNNAAITNCYSTGRISAGRDYVGGFIGFNGGTVDNSYWDINTSGYQESAEGEGRTTAQMTYEYDAETYVGWNFQEIWVADTDATVNDGYPYLFHYSDMASPNPRVATNPAPEHQSEDISTELAELSWDYVRSVLYADPVGFRVYVNSTGEFGDEDDYEWIPYNEEQERFSARNILPELEYAVAYYWKVVPTTVDPNEDGRRGEYDSPNRKRRQASKPSNRQRPNRPLYRGDAQNCPVWRFTAEISAYPDNAINPNPADEAEDVPLNIDALSWNYINVETHVNPVGFRVYLNTTGEFNAEEEYGWVDYTEGEQAYYCSDILPEQLESSTTYYWTVIPTTIPPDEDGHRGDGLSSPDRKRHQTSNPSVQQTAGLLSGTSEPYVVQSVQQAAGLLSLKCPSLSFSRGQASLCRGDAQNSPVWSFTTVDATGFEDNLNVPHITALHNNYPNPFNPATTISFSIAEPGDTYIYVFNIGGRRVKKLIDGEFMETGRYRAVWSGKDEDGNQVSSGVYFYEMRRGDYVAVRKMLLLR